MEQIKSATFLKSPRLATTALIMAMLAPAYANSPKTPIKHVIIVVGENRTFDNLFGAYKPTNGQHVDNLLSKGFHPGERRAGPELRRRDAAYRRRARAELPCGDGDQRLLRHLAATLHNSRVPAASERRRSRLRLGERSGQSLSEQPAERSVPDHQRMLHPTAFTGDPVHRFFQMWQDTDGSKHDKFVWVEETIGKGSNGNPPPFGGFNPKEGAISMGFYNMSRGDAPFFKSLAEKYAMSDNYHQPVMGGTGANFQALVTGHAAYFTDWINLDGSVATPPSNQIENPNPASGTNNYYTQDGYSGGSYVNCADNGQPGVRRGPERAREAGRKGQAMRSRSLLSREQLQPLLEPL